MSFLTKALGAGAGSTLSAVTGGPRAPAAEKAEAPEPASVTEERTRKETLDTKRKREVSRTKLGSGGVSRSSTILTQKSRSGSLLGG